MKCDLRCGCRAMLFVGSLHFTITATTMGDGNYNSPIIRPPLRTVAVRGNDPNHAQLKTRGTTHNRKYCQHSGVNNLNRVLEYIGLQHMEVSLNYCSQNGGNVYRAPYYNRNLNIGPRIDSNLGQSPYKRGIMGGSMSRGSRNRPQHTVILTLDLPQTLRP